MIIKWIGFGVASSLLCACVSVLPQPETPDALYSIEASTRHAGLVDNIIVREPEAGRLIAGRGMVSETGQGGLRLISGAEWSGSATRELQFAMIGSFQAGGAGSAVAPELGILANYELASRLTRLQMEGTRARCAMVVSVIESKDRSLLARVEISAESDATSKSSADRARALKAAASDCAAQASKFAIDTLNAPG